MTAEFLESRKVFHASLLESILTTNSQGVVSNADSSNATSKAKRSRRNEVCLTHR